MRLAFSGEGFRATLFHCGPLRRLSTLGILANLDRVPCVSGGSITASVSTRRTALQVQGDLDVTLRSRSSSLAGRSAPGPSIHP